MVYIPRRLALAPIAACAISCAAARLPVAPLPSEVRASVAGERDWFSSSLDIQSPAQLRAFEPLLEEISGQRPVPHGDVSFVAGSEVKKRCGDDAGGCYLHPARNILIGSEWPSGEPEKLSFPYGPASASCKAPSSMDVKSYSRLSVWIHEQGHHFDLHLSGDRTGKWIDQLEAVAFEYYAAEHIARRYDRHLGLNLLLHDLERSRIQALSGDFSSLQDEWQVSGFRKLIADFDGGTLKPGGTELAHQSFLALLGSGYGSFGEVWHFIHTSSHETVADRVRGSAGNVSRGRSEADRIIFSIAGAEPASAVFDSTVLDALEPGKIRRISYKPAESLIIDAENYKLDFHMGHDIFILLRKEDAMISATYTPSRNPIPGTLTVSDATGVRMHSEFTGSSEKTTVFGNTSISEPSFCASSESPSRAELHAPRVRGVFERARAALEGSGRSEEAGFSGRVISAIFDPLSTSF